MSKLVWDKAGEHFYETGVDHGVLYPTVSGAYGTGVVWNGLTGVTESPSGAESTGQYADNIKYLNLISAEEFGATVEAFTYPPEFSVCDGSAEPIPGVMIGQQTRRPFGFCYRTQIGNDLEGTEYGYKLHIIYGATASPSERAYSTINDSPEALTFSWEVTTTPVEVSGYKPTASITIDSTKVSPSALAALEDILYGSQATEPRLPMPDEVFAILGSSAAITLTIEAPSGTDNVLGKLASDLQTNVVLTENNIITGTLKYVSGFTSYSEETALQEGNYLALEVSAAPIDVEVTAELLGSSEAPKKPDLSGMVVFRVTNTASQSVKITAIMGRETTIKTYKLTGMKLETAVG